MGAGVLLIFFYYSVTARRKHIHSTSTTRRDATMSQCIALFLLLSLLGVSSQPYKGEPHEPQIRLQRPCFNGTWDIDQRLWVSDHQCVVPDYSIQDMASFLNGKAVVFMGNSVSRHLYFKLFNMLSNITSNDDDAARRNEKTLMHLECTTTANGSLPIDKIDGLAASCTEDQLAAYPTKWRGACMYNINHLDNICTRQWNASGYSGNITFVWVVDWFAPLMAEYLSHPNTILSPNAGLNQAWMKKIKLKINPLLNAQSTFPTLWNAPVANSSVLVYRQSTEDCERNELVMATNNATRTYADEHPETNKHVVDLDIPTRGRHFYVDCTHQQDVQTTLHIRMILHALSCPAASTPRSSPANQTAP